MEKSRRVFLKGTLAGSMVAVAAGAGLLTPGAVLAAWPAAAFEAKSVKDAMTALVGTDQSQESADITIKAPDIAENGSVVPITVETAMQNLQSIGVLASENALPLAVLYEMTGSMDGYVSTRIKMGKTSDVVAVVRAGDKVFTTTKSVKVTLGGCGG